PGPRASARRARGRPARQGSGILLHGPARGGGAVSGGWERLVDHTWGAGAAGLAAFPLLYAVLQAIARPGRVRPEPTRKLLHTGSGLLTLAFPFLFRDIGPVLLLTGARGLG